MQVKHGSEAHGLAAMPSASLVGDPARVVAPLNLDQLPYASKDETSMMQAVFNKFDQDGGGNIDIHELGEALREMGKHPSPEDLQKLMQDVDRDKSGTVEFEEFCSIMGRKVASADEEVLIEAFKVFDKDGSGDLDREELRAIFASLGTETFRPPGDDVVDEMIKEADIDGDGKINRKEFVKLMIDQQAW